MCNAAYKPGENGAAFGMFCVLISALLLLTACGSSSGDRLSLAPPPPPFSPSAMADGGPDQLTLVQTTALQYADTNAAAKGLDTDKGGKPCRMKDRFDRSSALSYRFADNQSKLALKLGLDGVTVNRAMLRFSYKFQPYKSPKERCLYDAPVQGLVGSVYNELIDRKDGTVWQELRAKSANMFGR